LKDGSKSREVMSIEEVEGVRGKSQALNGPWKDPVFYPEMVRKTVARRHSKVLPMSSDLDDLIRRDDALYDLAGARDEAAARNGGRPQSLATSLDNLAKLPSPGTQAEPGDDDETPPAEAPQEPVSPPFGEPAPAQQPAALLQSLLAEIAPISSNREAFEWAQANVEVLNTLPKAERAAFDKAFLAKQDGFSKPKKKD
jgi:recombination protein RecT